MVSVDPTGSHKVRTNKLASLEIGRGIAAIAVVAHHAELSSNAFTSGSTRHWFSFGALGVDFFFVLSGFIIFYVHGSDTRSFSMARRYLGRRLKRIFVPYLPVSAALIVAYLLLPGLSEGNRDWGLLTSLTLLPSDKPPALSVAWTLTFELVFYLFFLLFYATRYFWTLVTAWAAVTISSMFLISGDYGMPIIRTFLAPITLEFIAGMAMAKVSRKIPNELWAAALTTGTLVCIMFFLTPDAHRVLFGIGLAPVVLGLALAEARFDLRVPTWALLLGAASYAIYLIHNPLQSLIARAGAPWDSWMITFLNCVFLSVIGGIIYHLFFEKPALKYFSDLESRRIYQLKATEYE
ncbi:acyltransferase family protein [Pacificitalea manganoxidans]|nr:acyltransferase [Pacificitalea manganoxidans]MDR6310407.1 peptidoglycan/LPS O-acetylase OafA/YrhL [Pacificitalea manganoxidans]